MQVVAAVVAVAAVAAVAAVDDEDGVQWWWWWWGAFNGGGSVRDGLRIGDAEANMAIDTSGGGWRQWASAFDGGDGRR